MANISAGRRLAVIYQQIDSVYQTTKFQHCKASTATAAKENPPSKSNGGLADEVEWENAKPIEKIPGAKTLPFVGTLWSLFPVIGKPYSTVDHFFLVIRDISDWHQQEPGYLSTVSWNSINFNSKRTDPFGEISYRGHR